MLFMEQSPTTVVLRVTLENIVTPDLVDEPFAKHATARGLVSILASILIESACISWSSQ